jgi:TPP-dependent pyruvate/acetoin dehydrogenase alpha subunit
MFLECVTYRRGAHSTSDDPARYRSAEEEATWAERDPVQRLRRELESEKALDEKLEATLLSAIDIEIDGAISIAEAEQKPGVTTLFDDVYGTVPWHLEEERRSLEG